MHASLMRERKLPLSGFRRLHLEPLEDRRVLDAVSAPEITVVDDAEGSPWQNPEHRLDVNNDGSTKASDAGTIINRILSVGTGELPDPGPSGPPPFYDTTGDNRLSPIDLLSVINGILTPPKVAVSSLTPFTADVTPLVTVTATDAAGGDLPDGTIVELDVDLNKDGDFNDPGETGRTQSTIFAGSSTFPITPALDRTGVAYTVDLRARVSNVEAVAGNSDRMPLTVDTSTSNALEDYVNAPDDSFDWEFVSSSDESGYTFYLIDMVSQSWRSPQEVDRTEWQHYLQIFVPDGAPQSTAILLIDGGSNGGEIPGPPQEAINLGTVAALTNSVVVQLPTVPNQPLLFADETSTRKEDETIAYTFDKFMQNIGAEGNETWPLLLPMVKSAVRAMDVAQEFLQQLDAQIDDFVVTGYSKRGWTTWLTAAVDDRVRAIIPGVFDNLNQGPQMVHHYGVYGFFADAVHDYEDLQIFERMLTDEAQQLSPITDPYRYLYNGRFDDMPKLLLNSPGDEFFVSDSAQFYFDDIPGENNYLRYFPNTGHGLGLETDPLSVIFTTTSFYLAVTTGTELPEFSWTVQQDGSILAQTVTAPTAAKLWQATNPNARDFRNRDNPDIVWTETLLVDQGGGTYVGDVPIPVSGATAYFIEFTFGPPANPFIFTTEVRVKSTLPFTPWPFGDPQVELDTLLPFTADVTPEVTVTAGGKPDLVDGTPLHLDVDLNDDGDFDDPGELGYTQSTLFEGSSTFQITPALPRTGELYTVNLRARVTNSIDLEGFSPLVPLEIDTRTSDLLANYVAAPDNSFEWELSSSQDHDGWTTHIIDMTSQTWRSPQEVDRTVWTHEVEIYVPDVLSHSTAYLLIDVPVETDGSGPVSLGFFADLTESVIVHVPSVPNQPLVFSDDTIPRREDRLLAYTFDKFMENLGQPGNETWPALLPMVKSIVRGMDVVQQFVPTVGGQIDDFLLSGYSKRGWTAWLTAAVDERVAAIMPGVYDLLNVAPQMVHHYGVLGRFYDALDPYSDMQIFDRLLTDEARELWTILDPYRYLNNGRFDDMPKLLLNGTGDEFFQPDSSQFYIHDLPGDKNYLRYFPNGNHGLGIDEDPTELLGSTLGFQVAVMNNLPMPEYSWTIEQDGSIQVQATTTPLEVKLWQATTSNRDFRIRKNPEAVWTSTDLVDQGGGTFVGNVPTPAAGATAYLVELTFPFPVPGVPDFVFTTEVRVKSTLPFHPWPFDADTSPSGNAPAAVAAVESAPTVATAARAVQIDSPGRNAVASAVAIQSVAAESPVETAALDALSPTIDQRDLTAVANAPGELMLPEAPPAGEAAETETDSELAASIFGSDLPDVLGST